MPNGLGTQLSFHFYDLFSISSSMNAEINSLQCRAMFFVRYWRSSFLKKA